MTRTTFLLGICALFCNACPAQSGGTAAATGPATDAPKDVLDRVNETDTLRAAYINYPPSMILSADGRKKSGIMHDVMAKAAKNLEVKLEYIEEVSWATMVEAVETGRVDVVVSGIWPSTARARRADFTEAVYYSPVYAYARADDARLDGDLNQITTQGLGIATIDGELSSIIAASDYPKAKVVSLPNNTEISQLLLQLTTKKADVTFVEGAVAEEFMEKNPGAIRRVDMVEAVRLFPNTFLLKKGETNLRTTLNIAIAELHGTGDIDRLLDRYDPKGTRFVRVGRLGK